MDNSNRIRITTTSGTPGVDFHSKKELVKAIRKAGLKLQLFRYVIEAPLETDLEEIVKALKPYERY